jgi:hypothetical protein
MTFMSTSERTVWTSWVAALAVAGAVLLIRCADEEPAKLVVSGYVLDASDSGSVQGANVMLFDANSNSPVTRAVTEADGSYTMEVDGGSYYLRVTAQQYVSSPPAGGQAVPFEGAVGEKVRKTVYLDPDPEAATAGSVSGHVLGSEGQPANGVLVVAADDAGTSGASAVSGPDGYFVLHNLQPGTYTLTAYFAGYQQTGSEVTVTVKAGSSKGPVDLTIVSSQGSTLTGKISFLASGNSAVDITLINPATREAIPGMYTFNDPQGLDYSIDDIPNGTYIAWASYRNDGYVMDPDWIRKNGLPTVTFDKAGQNRVLDFSVTGAIRVDSPTNPADSILPVAVATTQPTFKWNAYSAAKWYIVEVFDLRGNSIWGGFDSSGTVRHTAIDFHHTSAVFNFDGSASDMLVQGGTYRWKVFADGEPGADSLELISASEDLRGLFRVDTLPKQ